MLVPATFRESEHLADLELRVATLDHEVTPLKGRVDIIDEHRLGKVETSSN
jgi:hypothetical protein